MGKTAVVVSAAVAVVAAFWFERAAMADDTYSTVLGLLVQCREVENDNAKVTNLAYWGLCHGRIEGYFTATETWAQPKPFCAPQGTTRQDIVKTFVRWAEDNPGKWHEPSYVGLLVALTDAFPCKAR